MTRARISALVLVNWKGVFYERYLLDRHVKGLAVGRSVIGAQQLPVEVGDAELRAGLMEGRTDARRCGCRCRKRVRRDN